MSDLLALDWVGYDRDDMMIRGMRAAGWTVDRDFFALRTDDQAANWHLVRAGGGVSVMQQAIGAPDPLVERLMPDIPLPHALTVAAGFFALFFSQFLGVAHMGLLIALTMVPSAFAALTILPVLFVFVRPRAFATGAGAGNDEPGKTEAT